VRVRRRGKLILRTELTPVVRAMLEHTRVPDDVPGRSARFFISEERLAAAWREHGAGILAEWIRTHPGTRPHGWWLFDAPEPRPWVLNTAGRESELDYLRRLQLLGCEERQALKSNKESQA